MPSCTRASNRGLTFHFVPQGTQWWICGAEVKTHVAVLQKKIMTCTQKKIRGAWKLLENRTFRDAGIVRNSRQKGHWGRSCHIFGVIGPRFAVVFRSTFVVTSRPTFVLILIPTCCSYDFICFSYDLICFYMILYDSYMI